MLTRELVLHVKEQAKLLKKQLPTEPIMDFGRGFYRLVSNSRISFFCLPVNCVTTINVDRLEANQELPRIIDSIISRSEREHDDFQKYEDELRNLLKNLIDISRKCKQTIQTDCNLFFSDILFRLKELKESEKEISAETFPESKTTEAIYVIFIHQVAHGYWIGSKNHELLQPAFISEDNFKKIDLFLQQLISDNNTHHFNYKLTAEQTRKLNEKLKTITEKNDYIQLEENQHVYHL